MADKRENIDVTVELHDKLSRPADRAEEALEDLGDEVEQLAASEAVANAETNRLTRALAALRVASGKGAKDTDRQTAATKRYAAAQKAAGKDGSVLGKVWEKVTKSGMKMFRMLTKLMILPAITGLIVAAAGALSALGAAGFAAVAGLTPLVGTLGAMPALILALVTAFAAVKIGFKGIGEALKVATDATKTTSEIEDALRGLTPQARELVGVLGSLKRETDGWGRSIQEAMLPQMSAALRSLRPVLPVVEKGLTGAGGAMGYLAMEVAGLLGSRGNSLELIFGQSTRMITNGLTPALRGATSMLLDFGVAGGPLAERFANYLGRGADNLARMTAEGRRTGGLRTFLNQAGELAANVTQTLADASVALYNIGKQSGGLSGGMGRGFSGMIADWRAWTSSLEGQNAIKEYFDGAQPVIDQVVRMLKILGQGFLNLAGSSGVADVLASINDELLPAMMNFASTVSSSIVPALVNFGAAFFDAYSLINTSPIPEVLMMLSEAAMALASGLASLPGPIKTVIVSLIALRAVAKFGGSTMTAFSTSMSPVRKRLADVRAGIQLTTEGMSKMKNPGAVARGAMMGLAGAGKGLMGALGGPWGLAIAGATIGLGIYAQKQAAAKQRVDDLKNSLDAQTGSITSNTKGLVANQLEEQGVLEAAQELGLNLNDVTDAALGNEDALKRITDQLPGFSKVADAATVNSMGMKNASGSSLDMADAADKVGDALAGTNDDLNKATASAKRQAEAVGVSTANSIGHSRAMSIEMMRANGLMSAADNTAGSMKKWGDQTQFVIVKTKALNDLMMKSMRSEIGFRQAVEDTRKVLFQGAMTLDLHSQAGRDNRSAMLDLVDAANGMTNAAKRQKALKEAEAIIREWGRSAGWSKGQIDNLVESMIKTQEEVRGLNGMSANITITANGLNQIITDADRARGAISDLVASQGQVRVTPRRDGGPVAAGAPYRVGEVGPELLVTAKGVDVIGRHGQEQRRFAESGYILPNEVYRAAYAEEAAPVPVVGPAQPDRRRSSDDGGDQGPVPEMHFHVPGSKTDLTEADFRRIALDAWRQAEREKKERR